MMIEMTVERNGVYRNHQVVRLAILVEGGLVVLAWVLGWLLSQPPLAHFHWDGADLVMGIAGSVPMLVMFLALLRWPIGLLVELRHFLQTLIPSLFGRCTLIQLGIIALLAGLGEEMLFRGVFQGAISRWLGPEVGLGAASALFGLIHFITPTYALIATLMGVYLGWLWQVSGNLLVPIVTHAVYDFVALVYFLRFASGKLDTRDNNENTKQANCPDDQPSGEDSGRVASRIKTSSAPAHLIRAGDFLFWGGKVWTGRNWPLGLSPRNRSATLNPRNGSSGSQGATVMIDFYSSVWYYIFRNCSGGLKTTTATGSAYSVSKPSETGHVSNFSKNMLTLYRSFTLHVSRFTPHVSRMTQEVQHVTSSFSRT